MDQIIGTCSICGGAVTMPFAWWSVLPPTPTCSQCGATAAQYGPVVQMQPRPTYRTTWTTHTFTVTPSGKLQPVHSQPHRVVEDVAGPIYGGVQGDW